MGRALLDDRRQKNTATGSAGGCVLQLRFADVEVLGGDELMVEVDFKRVGSGLLRHARERTDEEIFLPHRAPLPLRLLEAYKLARIVSDNEHDPPCRGRCTCP